MSRISFVYFDVGGVAIRDFSDTDNWIRMMDFMGIPADKREKFDALYDEYDDRICTGLDIDSLIPEFSRQLDLKLPQGFSMNRYFVDHFSANPEIVKIAEEIKKSTRVGLLTDIYPGMLDLIFEKSLIPRDLWDVVIDSSREKMRKPDDAIYALAQKKAGVPAGEILFIDNKQKNLNPAVSRGWQTYLYDSKDYNQSNRDLSGYLKSFGVTV